jgi:glycosyltransferase involved in cell wall biosynthesis
MATTTGGVGQVVLGIARSLSRERFEVAAAFGPGYFLDRRFRELGVRTYELSTTRCKDLPSVVMGCVQVYRILKRDPFDIVHGHTAVGGVIARIAGRLTNTPVVFTVHNWASAVAGQPAIRGLLTAVEKWLDRFTDQYVLVSCAKEAEGIRNGVLRGPGQGEVILNGIDVSSVAARATGKDLLDAVGIDRDCPVIGMVTRLERQKGVDVFLRAVARIADEIPSVTVLVAGCGPLTRKMRRLASRLGIESRVKFLGLQEDPVPVMSAVDVFCMSSRWEGLPIAVLEAMALGKPVVAADAGGTAEVVDDGVTGLVVPREDPEALADAVLDLLRHEDKRRVMGRAGMERVAKKFTSERMASEYERIYMQMVPAGTGLTSPPPGRSIAALDERGRQEPPVR